MFYLQTFNGETIASIFHFGNCLASSLLLLILPLASLLVFQPRFIWNITILLSMALSLIKMTMMVMNWAPLVGWIFPGHRPFEIAAWSRGVLCSSKFIYLLYWLLIFFRMASYWLFGPRCFERLSNLIFCGVIVYELTVMFFHLRPTALYTNYVDLKQSIIYLLAVFDYYQFRRIHVSKENSQRQQFHVFL